MPNQRTVPSISPKALDELRASGQEIDLIDVSTPAEFREVHVDVARNVPINSPELQRIVASRKNLNKPLHVMCHAGVRGRQVCSQFAAANLVNVEGGTRAWVKSGLPVVRSEHGISLERQVQIAAGTLICLGSILGLWVHPYFATIPALAGAALVLKGITGTCAMGVALARIPWRRMTKIDFLMP